MGPSRGSRWESTGHSGAGTSRSGADADGIPDETGDGLSGLLGEMPNSEFEELAIAVAELLGTAPSVTSTVPVAQTQATDQIKVNPEDDLPYVWIPPCTFKMGAQNMRNNAANYDRSASYEEGPVHEVRLKSFFSCASPLPCSSIPSS
jgi:hypothetical protein